MKNKRTPYPTRAPRVNTGLYEFLQRIYALINDMDVFSNTPEGDLVSELDYVDLFEGHLRDAAKVLLDCISHEVCEIAYDSVSDNNPKFAGNERE